MVNSHLQCQFSILFCGNIPSAPVYIKARMYDTLYPVGATRSYCTVLTFLQVGCWVKVKLPKTLAPLQFHGRHHELFDQYGVAIAVHEEDRNKVIIG